MSYTVTVEVDPSKHSREPENEVERLAWAILDTTWKVLSEGAVRITLAEIRSQAPSLPSDEELFRQARESGVEYAPQSYADLAPEGTPEIKAALALMFEALADQAFSEAAEGMGLTVADEGE